MIGNRPSDMHGNDLQYNKLNDSFARQSALIMTKLQVGKLPRAESHSEGLKGIVKANERMKKTRGTYRVVGYWQAGRFCCS